MESSLFYFGSFTILSLPSKFLMHFEFPCIFDGRKSTDSFLHHTHFHQCHSLWNIVFPPSCVPGIITENQLNTNAFTLIISTWSYQSIHLVLWKYNIFWFSKLHQYFKSSNIIISHTPSSTLSYSFHSLFFNHHSLVYI